MFILHISGSSCNETLFHKVYIVIILLLLIVIILILSFVLRRMRSGTGKLQLGQESHLFKLSGYI